MSELSATFIKSEQTNMDEPDESPHPNTPMSESEIESAASSPICESHPSPGNISTSNNSAASGSMSHGLIQSEAFQTYQEEVLNSAGLVPLSQGSRPWCNMRLLGHLNGNLMIRCFPNDPREEQAGLAFFCDGSGESIDAEEAIKVATHTVYVLARTLKAQRRGMESMVSQIRDIRRQTDGNMAALVQKTIGLEKQLDVLIKKQQRIAKILVS